MARTREYSAEQMVKALRNASGVVAQAASALNCDPSTVYRYVNEYSTVERAMRESREDLAGEAETHLVQMMRDKDNPSQRYKATKDILRNYHPDDWTDKRKEADFTSGGDKISEVNLHIVDTDPDDFENERRE